MPTATMGETLAVITDVVLPNLARGTIRRRLSVAGLSERSNTGERAVYLLARLQERYGRGPLLLKLPFRRHALVLDPQDVDKVLQGSPEMFAPATWENKQALVSHGSELTDRRPFNEEVPEPQAASQRLAANLVHVSQEEANGILRRAHENNETLDWEVFSTGWLRAFRRIVLGDSAGDDDELTGMLDNLRRNANWTFLRPRQATLRIRFMNRLRDYVGRGEQGSLASVIKAMPDSESATPEEQILHWLFAFDPTGMAAFRTLTLLATHPQHAQLADMELADPESSKLPFLRACVLESLRLWPTTPLILRESTRLTHWKSGALWAGSNIIIFTPFFHRDPRHLPAANQFDPGLWLTDEPETKVAWPVLPFSSGTAMYPGRHIVLLATSQLVGALWKPQALHLHNPGRLTGSDALPATLDNHSLRFTVGAQLCRDYLVKSYP